MPFFSVPFFYECQLVTFEICENFFPSNSAHVFNQYWHYSTDGASKNVALCRIGDMHMQ